VSGAVLHIENVLFPLKFDGWLCRVDIALGLSSFPLAYALRFWAGPAFGYIYTAMLPMMLLWYALSLHLEWEGPSILWAYFVEMTAGPLL
jgi:hypothetical protein